MDPGSINKNTFRASTSAGPLDGSVSYASGTATLLLTTSTLANTLVTATLSKAIKDTSGVPLYRDYVWTFTTGTTSDTTPPTVSSTDPNSGETGIATNHSVTAVFSESMSAETINTSSFKLQGPGGPVAGTVKVVNNIAVFNPTANLSPNTSYTAGVTADVKDLSDNPLAIAYAWTFTTGSSASVTPPIVISTDPAKSATGVSVNQSVSITFSDPMDVPSLNSANLKLKRADGVIIPVTISYSNRVAILNPGDPLQGDTVYAAQVKREVKNTSGVAMKEDFTWNFTTKSTGDKTDPTVLSTNPSDHGTNVFLNQSINAKFSEAMRASSLSTATFSVSGVSGIVSYDTASNIATFRPLADLAPNTTYTAVIEKGARDLAGNGLADRQVWTFTTGVQRSQTRINLGAASNYAVLAGSTVTNAGPTVLNGDLGVSPGSAVTGFPPGLVNGSIHAGDSVAAKAKADLLAGQLDAAGRLGGATLPGNLSGLTFTPGLYKNSTSVILSAGNVTFDAQGDPDAVFILQMGSTLTTATGTHVILAGGAKAANIYWSVGSSATLGVNSIFKGIILAEVSITVNNGAVTTGTFLTKTGAVTLQANTVNRNSPPK